MHVRQAALQLSNIDVRESSILCSAVKGACEYLVPKGTMLYISDLLRLEDITAEEYRWPQDALNWGSV